MQTHLRGDDDNAPSPTRLLILCFHRRTHEMGAQRKEQRSRFRSLSCHPSMTLPRERITTRTCARAGRRYGGRWKEALTVHPHAPYIRSSQGLIFARVQIRHVRRNSFTERAQANCSPSDLEEPLHIPSIFLRCSLPRSSSSTTHLLRLCDPLDVWPPSAP